MKAMLLKSAARWALTMLGTWLVAHGYANGQDAQQFGGALLTVFTLGWAMVHHVGTAKLIAEQGSTIDQLNSAVKGEPSTAELKGLY